MINYLEKQIKEFIAQSCESYSLTTNKQIKDLAISLEENHGNITGDIAHTDFEFILENELTSDLDRFYNLTGDLKLAQLTIDIANEMEIPLLDMFDFNKFIEHKILEDKIFGEVKAEDLKYFDYEQIWEDKFQDTHYISGHNCIVEFIKEN
jgi:hypothetical protein